MKQFEKILSEISPNIEVWAFGSRVKGTSKIYSDLNLALISDEKIELKTIFLLEEAFDESNLPFKVDVLDYDRVDPNFQVIIDQQYEVVQKLPFKI